MDAELSALLNSILWGRRYINVEDSNEKTKLLIAKELELQDKIWIDFIYKQALANGKDKKLLPEAELAVFLDKCGVWTKKDAKDIQNLKISLARISKTLNEDISKREYQISTKLQKTLTTQLKKKEEIRSTHFINSLEIYANSQRVNASIFSYLYRDVNNKYWTTWEDFLDETDNIFIRNAANEIFKRDSLTIKQIRAIARSGNWRFRWAAYKTSGDLFGKPLIELTNDQDTLVYWSQVYDAAYESMDRPAQSVIDDDDALDKWFEDQAKKRKTKETESGKGDIGRLGTSRVWRHSEVGIITNPQAQADINRSAKLGIAKNTFIPTVEEVNNLNSPLARKLKKHEEKKIKRYGVIEERDLRSDANSRRAIGSKDVIFKKARRSDGFTGKQIIDRLPGGTLSGRKE